MKVVGYGPGVNNKYIVKPNGDVDHVEEFNSGTDG
jgi:hypothetical protein